MLSIYKSFNTWSWSKYWLKSLKRPFWIFQAFEIFTKEIFSIKYRKILACQQWRTWGSYKVSCHGEHYNPMKPSQNHFYPFSSLNIFALSNMSKWSQTWCTCSNGVIMHLDQMAQVGENVILIKVPQSPSCLEPNLNNSTLPSVSFWSEFLWTCSNPQMMRLHQVVHQGEKICMTKSWKIHFCWFLGFAKVTLATLLKWTQTWWPT